MILFPDPTPEGSKPGAHEFSPGDLIVHRRYGYRGVIVAFDKRCAASEQWYSSNLTQPKRAQPWYHVLVHDTGRCTYAALENLMRDPHPAMIVHPLLDQFFHAFAGDRYLRNDRPWGFPTA